MVEISINFHPKQNCKFKNKIIAKFAINYLQINRFNGNSDTHSRVSINDGNYMRDIPVYNIGTNETRQSPIRPMTANNFYQKPTPISSATSSMLMNP